MLVFFPEEEKEEGRGVCEGDPLFLLMMARLSRSF
jgi:hypothetical protein